MVVAATFRVTSISYQFGKPVIRDAAATCAVAGYGEVKGSFIVPQQQVSKLVSRGLPGFYWLRSPNRTQATGNLANCTRLPTDLAWSNLARSVGADLIRSAPGLPLKNSLQSLLPLTQGQGIEAEKSRRTKRRYSGSKHISVSLCEDNPQLKPPCHKAVTQEFAVTPVEKSPLVSEVPFTLPLMNRPR
jgi:hypothetical protein